MPLMNGLEVLEWLQAHPADRVVPTVVLTGSNEISDVQSAYDLGAQSFFTKPTALGDRDQLIKMIFEYWHLTEKPVRPEPFGGSGSRHALN